MKDFGIGLMAFSLGVLILGATLGGSVAVWQNLRVYVAEHTVLTEELRGEAEFKRAEQNRLILIEQAKAEEQAATFRANAIGIVGQAAKDFPEYRTQEFLGAFGEALTSDNIHKIIFVPTEAGIPITEAGRTVD
jgi:regulator of protease activity HflC (stomatin/prohibitin superfamily)